MIKGELHKGLYYPNMIFLNVQH